MKEENEWAEAIKTSPFYPYLLQGEQALSSCKPVSVGRPSDSRDKIHDTFAIQPPPLHKGNKTFRPQDVSPPFWSPSRFAPQP